MSLDVDEDEHSIEMHLPFIFKVQYVTCIRESGTMHVFANS